MVLETDKKICEHKKNDVNTLEVSDMARTNANGNNCETISNETAARIKMQVARKYWNTFEVGQMIEMIDVRFVEKKFKTKTSTGKEIEMLKDVKELCKVTCKIISKNDLYMSIDKNGKIESITFADVITGHAKIRHRLNKNRVLTKVNMENG